MVPFQPYSTQDTLQHRITVQNDSGSVSRDTAGGRVAEQGADSLHHHIRTQVIEQPVPVTDTVSVCSRNSIEDVTFYDSLNLVNRIDPPNTGTFPFIFTEKNRIMAEEARAVIVKQLRPGMDMIRAPFSQDWIIIIILAVALIYALIRDTSANIFHGAERFFLFRGTGDKGAREAAGLFNWETTLKNLISFMILGLYGYAAAAYNDAVPGALPGLAAWLIITGAFMAATTMRHAVCYLTGMVSDTRDVFAEYIATVYQFYHFGALFIFVITTLMLYTRMVPAYVFIISGIAVMGLLYLIRILRLFIIFINSNISLYYLILYLCALEILPVVISVKYFSGLV